MSHFFAEIDRNPSRRKRLELAAVLAGGLSALALLAGVVKHHGQAGVALAVAAAVLGLLALVPATGRVTYVAWMGLGLVLGAITTPIVLLVGWLVAVTPLGLLMRLAGRDPMKRRFEPDAPTYWEPHGGPDEPASYFRQF